MFLVNKDVYIIIETLYVSLQSYDERLRQQDLKTDSAFTMPYSYHHHHHQPQQQQQQQQQQHSPSSSSQTRQCLDRPTDHLQPSAGPLDDVGPGTAADLIDLSRSRRAAAATDGRRRPSAAVHPHRPAATTHAAAVRPSQVDFINLSNGVDRKNSDEQMGVRQA